MNRNNDFTRESQNASILSSSSMSSNGTGRVSSSANTSLMNGSGQIIYRRSPNHYPLHVQSSSLDTSAGPPHSEDLSETLDSFEEHSDENITELSKRFDQLQRQFEQLTETQTVQEERYKRARQENDLLLGKIHSLEDQLRELELNSEARAKEDEKRFKDTMSKQMKMRSQECEQHLHSNFLLQQDLFKIKNDLMKNETLIRTLRSEKETLEVELNEKNNELANLDQEVHSLRLMVKNLKDEENVKSNLISILNEELEDSHNRSHREQGQDSDNPMALMSLNNTFNQSSPKQRSSSSRRSSVTSGFAEDFSASNALSNNNKAARKDLDGLETSLAKLRDENRRLKEANEELQAQLLNIQLEEGRSLVQEGNKSYSLADEMGDIDVQRLMKALKEQQDDNARLKKYMEGILLKIVEKNPEILEKTEYSEGQDKTKST